MGDTRHNGFELLVFDWDGTLMDSIRSIVECTQAALAEIGLPPAEDRVIRDGIGLGLRETVERFAPGCDEATFRRIVDVYRRLWFDEFSRAPRLFPGVEGMLEHLRRKGYLLAIATGKSRRGLNLDLAATGVDSSFDTTRTVDEARSKPHPQMIFDIVSDLGVAPKSTLVIGDSRHDLAMAHNAGAQAAGVCSGAHSRAGLEAEAPLACLSGVHELIPWLEGRRGSE